MLGVCAAENIRYSMSILSAAHPQYVVVTMAKIVLPRRLQGSISLSSSLEISRVSMPSSWCMVKLRDNPSDTYQGSGRPIPFSHKPGSPPISSSKLQKTSSERLTIFANSSLQ